MLVGDVMLAPQKAKGGHKNNYGSVRPQHPMPISKRAHVIGQMLQHIRSRDDVESVSGEIQSLRIHDLRIRGAAPMTFRNCFSADVDPNNVGITILVQAANQYATRTADLQDL